VAVVISDNDEVNTRERSKPSPGGSSSSTIWIIGGIIAVLVVVAGTIAIVSSGGDTAASTPVTVTSVNEQGTVATVVLQQTQPVTVTGAALPPLGDGTNDAALGLQAPTLSGKSFDGTPVTVAPGKATLVVFLAHWCPHCQREVPRLVSWFQAGKVPAGLDVFGVATATTTTRGNYPPSDWLQSAQFPWPVLADSEKQDAAAAFGLDGFPFFVLLDSTGKVVLRQSGEIETDALTTQINAALGH
jgi:thiol-disulfide isomerase/thioredoxin